MNELATLTLRAEIPAETVHSACMLMTDEYKPIVSEALQEMKEELQKDKSQIRSEIKDQLKRQLKHEILESLKDKVAKVARRIDYNRFINIDALADEIFGDMLDKMMENYKKK